MKSAGIVVALVLLVGMAVGRASATALKFCNDTGDNWRVRVDYGDWQYFQPQPSYCACSPRGPCPGWGDIAEHVSHEWYNVEFEVKGEDGSYVSIFSTAMQGNFRTNVARVVYDGSRYQLSLWWEFGMRGKCRDKPPLSGCRGSCLISHEDYQARLDSHDNGDDRSDHPHGRGDH